MDPFELLERVRAVGDESLSARKRRQRFRHHRYPRFRNRSGGYLRPANARRKLTRIVAKTPGEPIDPGIKFHGFRHLVGMEFMRAVAVGEVPEEAAAAQRGTPIRTSRAPISRSPAASTASA